MTKKKYYDPLLRDYQQDHAGRIYRALYRNGGALDGSDTGTGKTYIAISVAKKLEAHPIIITPRTVIPGWKEVAKLFKKKISVSNYEQYRNGNTDYVSFEMRTKKKRSGKEVEVKVFEWHVPEGALIIFDEVHRCKDWSSQNSGMLEAAADQDLDILCLSATVGDNPMHFYAVGKALRMFLDMGNFMSWAYRHGMKRLKRFNTFYFSKKAAKKFLPLIHEEIYEERGSRISIADLGDKFPENTVISDCYDMGKKTAQEINRIYAEMGAELGHLNKKKSKNQLVDIMRQRQEIELLKVPTFIELAQDHIEEGMSVAIFVNFTETINALSRRLRTKCIIDGSVVDDAREQNRVNFQKDKERIVLCNIKAGGVGISLHDIRGEFPRVGLISPTWSAIDLIQTFGRLPRDGALSKVLQKIVFCADTIEEDVAKKVSEKVNNIKLINEGDLI